MLFCRSNRVNMFRAKKCLRNQTDQCFSRDIASKESTLGMVGMCGPSYIYLRANQHVCYVLLRKLVSNTQNCRSTIAILYLFSTSLRKLHGTSKCSNLKLVTAFLLMFKNNFCLFSFTSRFVDL